MSTQEAVPAQGPEEEISPDPDGEVHLPAACPKIDHHQDRSVARWCWADGCLARVPIGEEHLGLCTLHYAEIVGARGTQP